MRYVAIIAVVALAAVPAFAGFSWESGETILGSFGNLVDPTNVSGPQSGLCGGCPGGTYDCTGPQHGTSYLHIAEETHDGTPQAFIAWVIDLRQGDEVGASFYGWDITPGASPSLRIWAHYTDTVDPDSYFGSAGGNPTYTDGSGWSGAAHDWIFAPADTSVHGLMIEARLYSTPSTSDDRTDFWIDYECVGAPEHATVIFPEPASPVEDRTWSGIKDLYR